MLNEVSQTEKDIYCVILLGRKLGMSDRRIDFRCPARERRPGTTTFYPSSSRFGVATSQQSKS